MYPFLKYQEIKLFLISLGLKQNAKVLYPKTEFRFPPNTCIAQGGMGTQTEIKASLQDKGKLVLGQ